MKDIGFPRCCANSAPQHLIALLEDRTSQNRSVRLVTHSCIITRKSHMGFVENIRCGGNDRRRGFYAAEWNGLSGDTKCVLSGDEDYD